MGEATDQVKRINYVDPATETSPGLRVPQADEAKDERDLEATQIRSGIEQTRANLSETIDATQEKLDPAHIAEQVKDRIRDKVNEAYDSAKDKVREATIEKVEKIMSNVSETVNDVTGRAGAAVKDTSSSLVQYIRDNPIPFALVGIGVGMMALNKRSAPQRPYVSGRNPDFDDHDRYQTARVRDGGLAGNIRGAAVNVSDTARAAADRAKSAVSSAASPHIS